MRVIWGLSLSKFPIAGPTVMTIGNFDGMHRGHQELIHQVVQKAGQDKWPGGLLTFEPHPMKVLFPERHFKNIFDLTDRIEMATKLGLNFMVVEPFSRELSQLTPEIFFQKLLVETLHVKALFVGHDFNFGKDRAGNLQVLENLCRKFHVELTVCPPVKVATAPSINETVSSTKVREAIIQGEMEKVTTFLGRTFFLKGQIEKGEGRGRKIGFPTANLSTAAELLPRQGVYVTLSEVKGKLHPSVTNVGKNPTFAGSTKRETRIETYLMDFDQDIYGETMGLFFLHYLRPEAKFDSVEKLVEQIKKDVKNAEDFDWPKHSNLSN